MALSSTSLIGIPLSLFYVSELLTSMNTSARYSRNQVRFVDVPHETNTNSANVHIINAALVAGLYPKVLHVEPKSGTLKTITNNQQSFFHPSSVNFGRNATDFSTRYLVYFTLMSVFIMPWKSISFNISLGTLKNSMLGKLVRSRNSV